MPSPCVESAARDRSQLELEFPGRECPWVLDFDEGKARLGSLAKKAPPEARGEAPEICSTRPCLWHGAETVLGPLVLAVPTSPQSEMPAGAFLGVVSADGLAFVDLWAGAGEPVTDDFTDLGPSHGLVPHVCDGQLALRAEPRLPAGEGLSPAPELLGREGIYDRATLERLGAWPSEADCDAVPLAMP